MFLPGESHEQRSLAGLKRVGHARAAKHSTASDLEPAWRTEVSDRSAAGDVCRGVRSRRQVFQLLACSESWPEPSDLRCFLFPGLLPWSSISGLLSRLLLRLPEDSLAGPPSPFETSLLGRPWVSQSARHHTGLCLSSSESHL